jgi:glucokinase
MGRQALTKMGIFVILLAGVLAVALAADEETIQGTISNWNDTDRSFQVKKADGQQVSIAWDGATQMYGTARVGQQVTVTARKEKGRLLATRIVIGDAKGPKG